MQVTATVIAENTNTWTGKKGVVTDLRLSLLDDDKEAKLLNTFDYDLSEEEKKLHAGKLEGKKIVLGVKNFTAFNGRLRAQGRILSVK